MVAVKTTLVAAAVFFGLFAPLQLSVGPYELRVVDIYASARQFSTVSRTFNVLGVSVFVNLTYPRLLVSGENFTFAYRVVVGDAPAGWRLNITRIVLEGDCIQRVTATVNRVLTDRQQLGGQFNVKITSRIAPGYTGRCDVSVIPSYSAVFGENRATANLPISAYLPLKSRELPLNLGLDIQGVKKHRYGEGYVFNASIRVRNTLNSDITITSLKYCPDTYKISPERIIGCSWYTKTLSSVVLKPGEERVFTYEDAELDDGSRYVAFVVQYLYEGGNAENWLVLSVTKTASTVGDAGTVTTRTVITPARGVTTTTILREPGTLDVIGWIARLFALIFATPFFIVNAMLWVVPVLLALIIGIPLIRKMRNRGSSLGALGATPSLATASHQTMLEVPHTTTVNPQETRRLRVPPDFDARCAAIISTFQAAYRYYFGLNDERGGVRGLYDAVNALLNLIFEAEGIPVRRLDDPRLEITMREKVRRLVPLGWISPYSASSFERLQALRNMASHSHEILHRRLTEPEEVAELFNFFRDYIPNTIAKLRALLGRDRRPDEKPDRKGPSYIG